jgi:tRNA 2-thiouridine synthesizing protein A
MLLSRGAPRSPLGVAAGTELAPNRTLEPQSHRVPLERRSPPMDVITATVDTRGQSCPGPLVALHKALRNAGPGDLLELLATDPGSKSDVPSWSKLSGNELLDASETSGVYRYVIRKV